MCLTGTYRISYVCAEFGKNILLLSKGITLSAKIAQVSNVQSSNENFSCNSQSTERMHSTCVNCSDLELNMDDFHNNNESITFHQWIRVESKIQKSKTELLCDEICFNNNNITVLKKHIYVKRQQHACYNKLKEELGENEA